MARPSFNTLPAGYEIHWYVIDSLLGKGGFGITYLAHDSNLDQKVAIKEFLPAELATRSGDSTVHPLTEDHTDTYGWGLNRFLHEARTLAKFRHDSIVRVLSVFEANNTAYMVMEYEEGQSLEDAYKFRKISGEAALRAILMPLLDGLERVHEAGFIHRDIKPDNIYLRDDGSPVLLDFGSARQAIGAETRTLTALVTPGYAPFEQYDSSRDGDKKQGPWTDIYSMGATLYRGVTGTGPPDAMQRVNAVVGGKDIYQPASELVPEGFSEEFLAGIDAALEFLPEKRPQTISEWRAMFGAESTRPATSMETDTADAATELRPTPTASAADEAATQRRGPTATPKTAASKPKSPATKAATTKPSAASQPTAPGTQAAHPEPETKGKNRWILPAAAVVVLAAIAGGLFLGGFIPGSSQTADVGETAEAPVAAPEALSPEEAARQRAAEARERAEEFARQAEEARKRADAESARVLTLEAQRELKEKIDGLLASAETDLEAGQMTSPEKENAFAKYKSVLELDPENADAKAGLQRIVDTLVAWADLSMSKKNFSAAAQRLDQAAQVIPGSASVDGGRQRLATARADQEAEQRRLAEEKIRQAEEAKQTAEAERLRKEAEAKRLAQEKAAQEKAQKIDRLLAKAEQDLAANKLIAPEGGNALAGYRAVLVLDPENAKAREGLTRLTAALVAQADAAAKKSEFDKAAELLTRADAVTPGVANVKAAREQLASSRAAYVAEQKRIAEEAERRAQAEREKAAAEAQRLTEEKAERDRVKKINTLLAQAEADLVATRLTSPAGKNAFERFRAVLELDPGNTTAQQGLQSIVARYLELKDKAVGSKNFDKAEQYLQKAETVSPGSEQLASAREAFTTARDAHLAATAKQRQAQQAARAEAERARKENEALASAQAEAERVRKENEALAKAQAELEKLKAEQARLQAALSKKQAPPASAPAPTQGMRVAIFPFGHSASCYFDRDTEIVNSMVQIGNQSGRIEFTSSAFGSRQSGIAANSRLASVPSPKNRKEAVSGSIVANSGKQNAPSGVTHGLTGWIECNNSANVDTLKRPIAYALVNLRTGKVEVTEEGSQEDIPATLSRLFSKAQSVTASSSRAPRPAAAAGGKIKIAVMPIGRGPIANRSSGGDQNEEISSRIDRVLKRTNTLDVLFHGYRPNPETDAVSNDYFDYWQGLTTLKPNMARVTSAMNTLGVDFAVLITYDVTASGYNSGIWNPTTEIYLVDKSGKQVGHLKKKERNIDYFDGLLKSALTQLEQRAGGAPASVSTAGASASPSARAPGRTLKIAILPIGKGANANSISGGDLNSDIVKSVNRLFRKNTNYRIQYKGHLPDPLDRSVSNDPADYWQGVSSTRTPRSTAVSSALGKLDADFALMITYDVSQQVHYTGVMKPATHVYILDKSGKTLVHVEEEAPDFSYLDSLLKSALTQLEQRAGGAPTPSAASAPSGPLKVAFLPIARNQNANVHSVDDQMDKAIIKGLHKFIRKEPGLKLVYSTYKEDLSEKAIDSQEGSLWEGGFTKKTPNVDLVYQIGQQLGVDVVVMVFYGVAYNGWVNNVWHPESDVYFIDVRNKKQYHGYRRESYIDYIDELIESVYKDYKSG